MVPVFRSGAISAVYELGDLGQKWPRPPPCIEPRAMTSNSIRLCRIFALRLGGAEMLRAGLRGGL